jgi:hypothetical protein
MYSKPFCTAVFTASFNSPASGLFSALLGGRASVSPPLAAGGAGVAGGAGGWVDELMMGGDGGTVGPADGEFDCASATLVIIPAKTIENFQILTF